MTFIVLHFQVGRQPSLCYHSLLIMLSMNDFFFTIAQVLFKKKKKNVEVCGKDNQILNKDYEGVKNKFIFNNTSSS